MFDLTMFARSSDLSMYNGSNLNEPMPMWNRPETILGVTIAFMVSSWIGVLLRLYTRLFVVNAAGWDDLFVGLYVLFCTMGGIAICIATYHGLGQHVVLISEADRRIYLMNFYVANASYILATAFIKLALLLQYIRLFQHRKNLRRLCIGLIVFTSIWGAAYGFLAWVPCLPVHGFWNQDPKATCYAFGNGLGKAFTITYETHSAINMVLDVLVLAIPVPLYFEKDTTPRVRLGLIGLFMIGVLVNAMAVWRLQTIIEHQAATYPTPDPTWYGPISMLLALIEVDLSAIAASIPIFWPVLQMAWGKIVVTKEVEVNFEDRYDYGLDSASRSRSGSQSQLRKQRSMSSNKETHYHDSFVLDHVDPLRRSSRQGVAARVMGGNEKREDGRKWYRF